MLGRLLAALGFFLTIGFCKAENRLVEAAIVVNARDGEIIYSYNADVKTQPASLAKMMTLLLVFKALNRKKICFSEMIRISARAACQRPSVLGLKSGESISVRNAVLALIVKSANDIAVAVAEHIGGTERNFVNMMNKEARRLGMSSTVFCNPSGWKDPRQLTTAKDMAKLARALLLEYPGYYHLFSCKEFRVNNKCIKGHYDLLGRRGGIVVDGIKTGFVKASGFNLAASAVKGGTRLITVVMGRKTGKERDTLTDLLLKKSFSRLISREIILKSSLINKRNFYRVLLKNNV
ncbi:MAG: D-alanyl-D-alanine carboxypeptidase [Holosporaceae bacterium]|nr:D-alanyl-D-alanine carboxypeptidase [Holosporaceae bacterium]